MLLFNENRQVSRHPLKKKASNLTQRTYMVEQKSGSVDDDGTIHTTALRLHKAGVEDDETAIETSMCAICLGEFRPGEVLRELKCGHTYHSVCFERWLILGTPLARCPMRCA